MSLFLFKESEFRKNFDHSLFFFPIGLDPLSEFHRRISGHLQYERPFPRKTKEFLLSALKKDADFF
ncbi:hypothetical protein DLM75_05115 [Leptospira stimsonii]|uniref:Uncharacterized protein n=1 Tax=Leptospira stimsonii TaxID=2202203 RepID=A0A396ZHD1_9LEPT|nr:hypothetical protein DLM75_05115 [Leptospira stimsonii]